MRRKKFEQSPRDPWNTFKYNNMHIMEISGGQERERIENNNYKTMMVG